MNWSECCYVRNCWRAIIRKVLEEDYDGHAVWRSYCDEHGQVSVESGIVVDRPPR